MKKYLAIFIFLFLYSNEIELNQIDVVDSSKKDIETYVKSTKIGTTTIDSNQIDKYQIKDQKDLVRYETGVNVVEAGRFGSSGYAIRGVDENRVAIVVDGLHQAQTLSSQGFKEIFEGYGNFNNIRNSPEMQNLKQATIKKGSDAITTGSGSLGGSVIFETKDARDFLIDKNYHYGFKAGYSSKDGQMFNSHQIALKVKDFDLLFIKTKRDMHEIRNYDYEKYEEFKVGRERQRVDPYNITKDSTLIKISYNLDQNNRFTIFNDDSKLNSQGTDYSYSLLLYGSGGNRLSDQTQRHTNDTSHRKNRGFVYENYSENPFWDSLKFTLQNQSIKNIAQTDEYCIGDHCKAIQNPFLKIVDGNIKSIEGTEIYRKNGETYYLDKNGNEILANLDGNSVDFKTVDEFAFDCSVYNCDIDKFHTYYSKDFARNVKKETLRQTFERLSAEQNKNFDEIKKDYSRYKTIQGKKYMFLKKTSNSLKYGNFIPTPNQPGHLENQWKKRYLNSDTKQINLDLKKYIDKEISHDIEYGFVLSRTDKKMINFAGISTTNLQWWANPFLDYNFDDDKFMTCEEQASKGQFQASKPGYTLNCRAKTDSKAETFLIPVKTNQGGFYISDTIKPTQNFALNLAYRYDYIKYKPYYRKGKDPKIPDSMVKDVFVKTKLLEEDFDKLMWDKYPKCKGKKWYETGCDLSSTQKAEIEKQSQENKIKNQKNKVNNVDENINYLLKDKIFKNHSFAFGSDIDVNENLRFSLKYSKGFRAPTTDEMYFTFPHPDFSISPNANLKQEKSYTKELSAILYNEFGYINSSIFKTDYKNFIDLVFVGNFASDPSCANCPSIQYTKYQNINRQNAQTKGFEIDAKLYLNAFKDNLKEFFIGYKITNQKGKTYDEKNQQIALNAISPRTQILSFGYDGQNFGVQFIYTITNAKNKKDTYNMFWESEPDKSKFLKYRNKKFEILDFIFRYTPSQNFQFFGGVYNILDKKYITWDSARSIRRFGTSNTINQQTGAGFERFYSPGRNFSMSFEVKF